MSIKDFYEAYEEDTRLMQTKASSVEFLTTLKYILTYVSKPTTILELGAATGIYTKALARYGHSVHAVELLDKHISLLKQKVGSFDRVRIYQKDACDLSSFATQSFPVVLCMGPMYHIKEKANAQKCMQEAFRVLQKGGLLFVSFVNHNACFISECMHDAKLFLTDDTYYDETKYRLKDQAIVFHTIEEMKTLIAQVGGELIFMFAQDGMVGVLANKINAFDTQQWRKWLNFHFYSCMQKEMLGYSNHIMCVVRRVL